MDLSDDPSAERREFFPGHTALSVYLTTLSPLAQGGNNSLVPTARTHTLHHRHDESYFALIVKIVYHLAVCDRAKMGYQNKLLVSRCMSPDRPDEDIGFTTSTHYDQVRVELLSDEERCDRPEDKETNTHVKEGPKFNFLLSSSTSSLYTRAVCLLMHYL